MKAAPIFSGTRPQPAAETPRDTTAPPGRPRINPWMRFNGAFIPNWLLCRTEVSHGAKLCYARLAQFAGKDGLCFPKQPTLAGGLGITERTARDYIRELEEFELVESVRRGLGTSNSYHFLDHPWQHGPPDERRDIAEPDRQNPSGQERQTASVPSREEIQGNGLHTHRARNIPATEAEALEAARVAGIPEDFAKQEFNRMEAVAWVDGAQRAVRSWSHYLKARWSREQSERAERPGRATRHAGQAPKRTPAQARYEMQKELKELEAVEEGAYNLNQPSNPKVTARIKWLTEQLKSVE